MEVWVHIKSPKSKYVIIYLVILQIIIRKNFSKIKTVVLYVFLKHTFSILCIISISNENTIKWRSIAIFFHINNAMEFLKNHTLTKHASKNVNN